METMQISKQNRINIRILVYEDIGTNYYDDFTIKLLKNNKEVTVIESYSEDQVSGQLLILPIFSKLKPTEKQAVLLTKLYYSNRKEAKMLVREALMCSWEMGFFVAFTFEKDNVFFMSEFQEIPENFAYSCIKKLPLLHFELAWNGLQSINNDLVFPKI